MLSISSHPQDQQTGGHTASACIASDPHYVWQYACRTVFHSITDPILCTARVCMCLRVPYTRRGDVLWALRNQLQFALIFPFSHMVKKRGEAVFNLHGHSPALQTALVTQARHKAQGWCSGKWRQAGLVLKRSSIPTCISFHKQQQGSVTRLRRGPPFTFCHALWF